MNYAGKYRKSLGAQWCLRFRTHHPDGDNYDGVVTLVKKDFIVLREERDFDFDGVIVLPKRSIRGYRDGKYEQCCNKILRQNGAIRKCRSPHWLQACQTLPQVISALKKRDIWPGVETLFSENTESAFYLGPITASADDYFYLKCYDAVGKWEKEYKLRYDEVFRVEFDSKYCNQFNAYMRGQNGT